MLLMIGQVKSLSNHYFNGFQSGEVYGLTISGPRN